MARDDASPSTQAGWAAATELAPMTGLWRRLLELHVPDARRRCRACTQGGTGIPSVQWPCGPRRVAEAAAQCHAERIA